MPGWKICPEFEVIVPLTDRSFTVPGHAVVVLQRRPEMQMEWVVRMLGATLETSWLDSVGVQDHFSVDGEIDAPLGEMFLHVAFHEEPLTQRHIDLGIRV